MGAKRHNPVFVDSSKDLSTLFREPTPMEGMHG